MTMTEPSSRIQTPPLAPGRNWTLPLSLILLLLAGLLALAKAFGQGLADLQAGSQDHHCLPGGARIRVCRPARHWFYRCRLGAPGVVRGAAAPPTGRSAHRAHRRGGDVSGAAVGRPEHAPAIFAWAINISRPWPRGRTTIILAFEQRWMAIIFSLSVSAHIRGVAVPPTALRLWTVTSATTCPTSGSR